MFRILGIFTKKLERHPEIGLLRSLIQNFDENTCLFHKGVDPKLLPNPNQHAADHVLVIGTHL